MVNYGRQLSTVKRSAIIFLLQTRECSWSVRSSVIMDMLSGFGSELLFANAPTALAVATQGANLRLRFDPGEGKDWSVLF